LKKAPEITEVGFNLLGPRWCVDGVYAIIFDKDGTLIDLHSYWAQVVRCRVDAILSRRRLPVSLLDNLCRSMGLNEQTGLISDTGPIGLAPRSEVIRSLHQCLESEGCILPDGEIEEVFDLVHENDASSFVLSVKALPGVHDFLSSAHAEGMNMAVVTSDSTTNAWLALEKLEIAKYFTTVVGRDRVVEPKDSGRPALLALNEMGCSATKAICVGDAPMDARMAVASGCRAFVGVATGQNSQEKLRAFTPFTADSFADLRISAAP
jgi:phosphoglycolate phosphatase